MKKAIDLILFYIKMNFQVALTYRANVLFSLVASLSYFITLILPLKFIFRYIPSLHGYSYEQFFLIFMLSEVWWYSNVVLIRTNFKFIADLINRGNLDFYLLKPYRLKLFIPVLQLDSRMFFSLIMGLSILFYYTTRSFDFGWIRIIGAVLFFLNGIAIMYFFTAIFTYLNFWVGRNNSIFDITFEFPELVKIPLDFFPFVLKGAFIFIMPVILMVNPAFMILLNRIDYSILAISIIMSLLLFIVSEILWKNGLKRYTSAN